MRFIRIADVEEPTVPSSPVTPMKENIKDANLYAIVRKLLADGRMQWVIGDGSGSIEKWSEMKDQKGNLVYYTYYSGQTTGGPVSQKVYRLDVYVYPNSSKKNTYNKGAMRMIFVANDTEIARWSFEGDNVTEEPSFNSVLASLGIKDVNSPASSEKQFQINRDEIRLTRRSLGRDGNKRPAEESIIRVSPISPIVSGKPICYEVYYIVRDLETGGKGGKRILARKAEDGSPLTFPAAHKMMNDLVTTFRGSDYVDETSPYYIPIGAKPDNWDFETNTWSKPPGEELTPDVTRLEGLNNEVEEGDILSLFATAKGYRKIIAEDYSGYFSGDVPDYAVNFLGTGSVEASQVNAMFVKSNDAIDLVNKFDSSLLSNVSFIFNFAKSGAYGVYLSSLDRAIKTKALQKQLEGKGYKVEPNQQGMLIAFPTQEEKSQEDIQNDIDSLYQDLEQKGGTAFGINMNAVLSAAKQDALATGSQDPEIWQWMAVLHLGGTLVHEAIHAKGHGDEGPSENAEQRFVEWALPIINEEYKSDLESQGRGEDFNPLTIGSGVRHASKKGWYRYAQMAYYVPQTFLAEPTGSDLAGRHALSSPYEEGRADWGMMMQQDQSVPIEKRLSRQYMSPLPKDLDQAHDIFEEQLRKYTRGDEKLDPKATTEGLLSEGHDENRGYTILEGLLDETRVKPLIVPLNKDASSKIYKTATLFGWMNNLEISDGSTIPGLSDRVMAWDDRDESFSEEEEWIKQQPRYNPSYDIKGMYYRWIEPRFKPELWDNMIQNRSGVHPAKRFASKIDTDLVDILRILGTAKNKIDKGIIYCTRFLLTEDVVPIIEDIFDGGEFDIETFKVGTQEDGETVYSFWIAKAPLDKKLVKNAEDYLQGYNDEARTVAEGLLGINDQKLQTIVKILDTTKNICREYVVEDVYLIGGYPRDLVLKSSPSDIEDLDFSSAWPNQGIKVGGLLAEKLGVKDVKLYHRTMTLNFDYQGVKIDFKGNFSPMEVRKKLRERGIKVTPLNLDVYNRDFTINMLLYNINKDTIHDISGYAQKDLDNGVIRTFFNSDYTCKQNPIIILRAIKFKIRYGFDIHPDLEKAMKDNVDLLFSGNLSNERLILARENVKKEGKKEAEKLFKQFGLEKLGEL